MLGTRRFVDFQHSLGIAKNILCNRLSRLVDNGVMVRVDVGEHGKRYEYRLTDKGRDLFTVITALRQWSERWNGEKDTMKLVDRQTGEPLAPVVVHNQQGQALTVRDVRFVDPQGKPLEEAG